MWSKINNKNLHVNHMGTTCETDVVSNKNNKSTCGSHVTTWETQVNSMCFFHKGWNRLPDEIRSLTLFPHFKKGMSDYIILIYIDSVSHTVIL